MFRENGADTYSVSCTWSGAGLRLERTAEHAFVLHRPQHGGSSASARATATVEISCRFQLNCCVGTAPPLPAPDLSAKDVPKYTDTLARSRSAWAGFWEGGAFDTGIVTEIRGRGQTHMRGLGFQMRTKKHMYSLRSNVQDTRSSPFCVVPS